MGGGGVFSPGGRTELVDGAGETRSGEPGVRFFFVFCFFFVCVVLVSGWMSKQTTYSRSKQTHF